MLTVPQLLPAIRESSETQQRLGTNSTSSRRLPTAAAAGAVAAGAAAVAAGAAAAMGQLPHPAPVRVSSSTAAAERGAKPLASNINAFVRDAGQTEAHDKVTTWLTADTGGSMELSAPPGEQQQQQQVLSQPHQQQQLAAIHPDAAGGGNAARADHQQQQQQQQLDGFAGAAGAAAAAAAAAGFEQQEVSDVFGAQDSPFFMVLPPCASSGTVDLGLFNRPPSSINAASVPAAAGNSNSMLGVVSLPSFMDAK